MLKRIAGLTLMNNSTPPSQPNPSLVALLDEELWNASRSESNSGSDEPRNQSSALEEEHAARLHAEAEARHASQRLQVAQQQIAEYAAGRAADARALADDGKHLDSLLSQALCQLQNPIPASAPRLEANGTKPELGSTTSSEADAHGPSTDGSNSAPLSDTPSGNGTSAEDAAAGDESRVDARLAKALAALRTRLADSANEASAFAALQQSSGEADRLKRSLSQAALDCGGSWTAAGQSAGNDGKRQRSGDGNGSDGAEDAADDDAMGVNGVAAPAAVTAGSTRNSVAKRAQFIPLRLNPDERRLLRLLEAALSVSEYTDKVDILSWKSKNSRVQTQIKDICAILSGLVIAQDYRKGQKMVTDRNFQDNAAFFRDVFEVGRRFRIMNPDRMRSSYGMLMHMLMDSAEASIQELLEFKCVRPLRTVYSRLEEGGGLALLADPLVERATTEILSAGRPRHEVQKDIRVKEKAREACARKYKTAALSEEDLLQCMYSIADNNSFLLFNRDPIDRMLDLLKENFNPKGFEDDSGSLAISMGRGGARLSHSHQKQFIYVLQSMTLWREIHENMFELWCHTDGDLLAEGNTYRLSNTGQGLNRVQACPRVSKAMHSLLARCQRRLGGWVGSAVVHLGDHNVPNSLAFIDKYSQVPRILGPVVLVVDALPQLAKNPKLASYIHSQWGGVDNCRRAILADFFRHAFDGAGADNFFDAGSCIDGRLTSAWHWCSRIEKKDYFPIFQLAGFHSFDGDLGR